MTLVCKQKFKNVYKHKSIKQLKKIKSFEVVNKKIHKKNRQKNIKLVLIIFLFYLISINFKCINAVGFFPKDCYALPQNKSMIICPSGQKAHEFNWKTQNENILKIDKKGVITAINQGNCIVEALEYKTGKTYRCKINVVPSECISYAYVFPCQAISEAMISFFAISDSNIKNIKFTLNENEICREIYGEKIKTLKDKIVWTAKISLKNPGEYTAEAIAVSENGCEIGQKRKMKFIVGLFDKSNIESVCSRYASENIIKFISSCEGFCSDLTADYKNKLSIGYGHIVNPFTAFYKNIIPEEAIALLIDDITNSSYRKILNKFLINNNIYLNQQQFDALLSFTYNLGTGWITGNSKLKNLILSIPAEENSNSSKFLGEITSKNGLNLRSGASVYSKKIAVLPYRERVEILNLDKYNNDWYLVKTAQGKTGYCHCSYLTIFSKPDGKRYMKNINKDMFIKLYCAYHHAGGKCNTALLSRRFHELDIFFNNRYSGFYHLYYKKSQYNIPDCMRRKIFKTC